jgi:hypothetical protein
LISFKPCASALMSTCLAGTTAPCHCSLDSGKLLFASS